MSQQIFCGRPGCGLAKSAHGFAPDACSNFIGKGSKEQRALKATACTCKHPKAIHMCGTSKCEVLGCKCGLFTLAKPDPKYISADSRDLDTKVESSPVDSSLLDRTLMEHTILDLEKRRKQAIHATQACLAAAKAGAPRTASRYAERALKALGGLGAS